MSVDPQLIEPLLEKLCQGDMAAAKDVFLAYESYLRTTVRRQLPRRLQAKFDSIDIVQSVWADLLTGYRAGNWHFPDARRLQAFLVEATRNRFIDRFRKHRVPYARERSLEGLPTSQLPAAQAERPPDLLESEELWQQMLALCPAEHRPLLLLKRQGLPMEELVACTGLHPGSIRRIFRNLARKLALDKAGAAPPSES